MGFLSAFVCVALASGAFAQAAFPDCVSGPLATTTVCDITANPVDRAAALVSLFTFDEKVNNTGNTSPGVPRLGLPAYQWWQEGLHGVAESPGVYFAESGPFSYATSFPQPILMSAAFDDPMIYNIATVISTEARGFNNNNRSGLDFWTPNINPFKDPRWGRGQETPGEDPFHLQSYVYNLITGLQGGLDPEYKRIVATCKHFAAYDLENWMGNVRYGFDAIVSIQDLSEFYTRSFRTCARDANVGAFMCSYNAVNGVPSCANSYLLQDILREHWGWTNEDQWVTSDCDAIENIYQPHYYAPTRQLTVADALNAGADLDCGEYYPLNLGSAYEEGLFNVSTLDRALIRLYSSLVKLGYFDPAENQPYRSIGWENVSTPAAEELAYTAAVEGITLLKNDGTLPLSSSIKSIALIGPWANATTEMQGNYYGVAPYLISPLMAAEAAGYTVYYATGPGIDDPTTSSFPAAFEAAAAADAIIYAGGINTDVEAEGMDRYTLDWPGVQIDLIDSLSQFGKPFVVLQMGGGQVDDSCMIPNAGVNAIIWGGYPGQSGGTALIDIIMGKVAPAGRLPITQYPIGYVYQIPMTDMSLRPSATSPGRTYMWYTGTPVFPFGYGLHYTNFTASLSESSASSYDISTLVSGCSGYEHLDLCPFASYTVNVTNTGNSVSSDFVALLFVAGEHGPAPVPNKVLAAYSRLHSVAPLSSQTTTLNLTLGSLARADSYGNTILYPGEYDLVLDVDAKSTVSFSLTGNESVLDYWPQPTA
ncbi:glycoside hydrolase family 3 protein [Laetiporus sulphureus 93-53]|uniref:xylan 1,4-beta-xylosidase n=1 Tax=Laetiporus sulphureus 93-53 TaxID=1314785 RepID=A0A165G9U4_9APHY|nr:glycoside hydrolase family 3 protein [Laetiporus sulphureus 93-53]KZT10041.1 glycoside hydrolase family 3 protein [Laetiporus sulphureus 93-53]